MINVIGLGYIGLPTALMFATHGVKVVGSDNNKTLVSTLNEGKTTFKEKGLDELFSEAVKHGIVFTTEYMKTDMYVVSVPTPYNKESKRIDATYVVEAVKEIIKVCEKGATIVIESTVAPGTIDLLVRPLFRQNGLIPGKDIHLAHAPERIIPGNMVSELLNNNRTIGADSPETGEKVRQYYSTFCKGSIVITDIRTAEMTKVLENTYRAVNIAFANEIMRICRRQQLDVYEIIRICNMHPRVNILQPGPGVGGHCISVDPWFLVGDYPDLAKVISQCMHVNETQPIFVFERIREIMKEEGIQDIQRVGLYGITYKENVDDIRESPSLQLMHLKDRQMDVPTKFYDPFVSTRIEGNQYHDLDTFLADVSMVVIMVKHDQIRDNMEKLRGKVILDCQNVCTLSGTYHL